MLLFKKSYLEAIRAGDKTQTIRLWKFRRMKAGQRSYIPGAGYIHIESVEAVELEDLSAEDVRRDGFSSLDELRAEIERLYPDRGGAGARPYRICFTVLPAAEQEELKRQKQQKKAAQATANGERAASG